jgi:hypothetical protein
LSIARQSWLSQKREASSSFWDIGQVPLKNFDWLSFTPLWSPSPVLHIHSHSVLLQFGELFLFQFEHARGT